MRMASWQKWSHEKEANRWREVFKEKYIWYRKLQVYKIVLRTWMTEIEGLLQGYWCEPCTIMLTMQRSVSCGHCSGHQPCCNCPPSDPQNCWLDRASWKFPVKRSHKVWCALEQILWAFAWRMDLRISEHHIGNGLTSSGRKVFHRGEDFSPFTVPAFLFPSLFTRPVIL